MLAGAVKVAPVRMYLPKILAVLSNMLIFGSAVGGETCSMVLVTNNTSAMNELTQCDLRKLFLGFRFDSKGEELTSVRNLMDDLLYKVFLPKVLQTLWQGGVE